MKLFSQPQCSTPPTSPSVVRRRRNRCCPRCPVLKRLAFPPPNSGQFRLINISPPISKAGVRTPHRRRPLKSPGQSCFSRTLPFYFQHLATLPSQPIPDIPGFPFGRILKGCHSSSQGWRAATPGNHAKKSPPIRGGTSRSASLQHRDSGPYRPPRQRPIRRNHRRAALYRLASALLLYTPDILAPLSTHHQHLP